MIQIEVNNSYSQVKNVTSAHMSLLKKELSYQTDPNSAYFSGGYQRTKYLIDAKGFFPTGLLNRVVSLLNSNKIRFHLIEIYKIEPVKRPISLSAEFKLTPYKAQQEAVKMATTTLRGCISMPTGVGKSLVIALIINKLKVNTLIIVPTLELKAQLTETFTKYFNDLHHITIENVDSPNLKVAKNYDCLIIDEAHHVAAKTYQKLNKTAWNAIQYRFFLTATPFRNKDEEQLLFEGIAGKVIYSISYKQAVSKGYIVPIQAFYIELPIVKPKGYSWAEIYKELVTDNLTRNLAISELIYRLTLLNLKTLCLVKEIAHGKKLALFSASSFINGQDDESRQYLSKFNEGKLNTLIGTTGILGEGVDTKSAEYVIIAGLGKAKSSFMQQVGRAVRVYPGKESAKIIIFQDKSHKWTQSHFKTQAKILLEEYGVKVLKLEL